MKKKLLALLVAIGLTAGVAADPAYATTVQTLWNWSAYATNGHTETNDSGHIYFGGGFHRDISWSGSGWGTGGLCHAWFNAHNWTTGQDYTRTIYDTDYPVASGESIYISSAGTLQDWSMSMSVTGWNCYAHENNWRYVN